MADVALPPQFPGVQLGAVKMNPIDTPSFSAGGQLAPFAGDPGIAAGGQSYNPAGNISNIASALTGLNQNRLFQIKLKSDLALGEALKRSIDPTTGAVDPVMFGKEVKQNPLVALRAPEVMQQIATQRATTLANQKAQLELNLERRGKIIDFLTPVVTKGQNATIKDFYNAIGQAQEAGVINMKDPNQARMVAGLVANMPTQGMPLAENVKNLQLQMMDVQEREKAQFGEIRTEDTGGHKVPMRYNPRLGVAEPVGNALAKTMTPGEAATPVVGPMGPGGAPQSVPKGALPGVNQGAVGPGAKPYQTALDPLSAQLADQEGKDFGKYITSLADAVNTGSMFQIQLERINDLMQEGTSTGGGTEFRRSMAQWTQALLQNTVGYFPGQEEWIQKQVDKVNQGPLGDTQELAKLAVQTALGALVTQLKGTSASRVTQLEFATYLENNPNLVLDPRANQDVLEYFQFLHKMNLAEQEFLVNERARAKEEGKAFSPEKHYHNWAKEMQKQGFIKLDIKKSGGPREALRKQVRKDLKEIEDSALAPIPIGTIEDGYRYTGGPVGDKSSWEKVE